MSLSSKTHKFKRVSMCTISWLLYRTNKPPETIILGQNLTYKFSSILVLKKRLISLGWSIKWWLDLFLSFFLSFFFILFLSQCAYRARISWQTDEVGEWRKYLWTRNRLESNSLMSETRLWSSFTSARPKIRILLDTGLTFVSYGTSVQNIPTLSRMRASYSSLSVTWDAVG
jgi:hypothetical protein